MQVRGSSSLHERGARADAARPPAARSEARARSAARHGRSLCLRGSARREGPRRHVHKGLLRARGAVRLLVQGTPGLLPLILSFVLLLIGYIFISLLKCHF